MTASLDSVAPSLIFGPQPPSIQYNALNQKKNWKVGGCYALLV